MKTKTTALTICLRALQTIGVFTILILASCSKESKQVTPQVQDTTISSTQELRFFDKGEITDTSSLKLIDEKELSAKLTDDSYKYLRYDNYCPDQFFCVVNGACYYRLTNVHPSKTIAGFVRKSYQYNNQTFHEDVPFNLVKGNWQHFGCHYVTASQPISFKIYAQYVQQVENPMISKNKSGAAEACSCGAFAEGSFICYENILYRCITDPYSNACYWYNWGTACTTEFF